MSSYKMVSNDYPSNTFTRLVCYASGGTAMSFEAQLPLPNQAVYQSAYDWSAETVPVAAQTVIDATFKKSNTTNIGPETEGFTPQTLLKAATSAGAALGKVFIETISKRTTKSDGAARYFYRQGFGTAYNPNKQLFFNGVDHKPLTLSFDIIAQNAAQASQCASAIKQIRIAASPTYSTSHTFFLYPSYFSVDIVVNGTTILQYNKFAITQINTNLSPNGVMSWHPDGKPVAYTLELSGIETEVSTSNVEKNRTFLGV